MAKPTLPSHLGIDSRLIPWYLSSMTPRTSVPTDVNQGSTGMDLEKFGDELATLRNRANMSLRDVAAEAGGVTASYIGVLEKKQNPKTDKPSRPTQDLVLRLARALRATVTETKTLAKLAGYEIETAADHQAVASILAMGRQPAVIGDLLELERDLFEYVDGVQMVEAPVLTVLGHLQKPEALASPVLITGVAFRARSQPARLFAQKGKYARDSVFKERVDALRSTPDGDTNLDSPLGIVVLGQLMTPTLVLLHRLNVAEISYKVNNSYRSEASLPGPESEGAPWQIEVAYGDEAQATLLKYEQVDLALMVHPFRQVQDGQFEEIPGLDLWTEYREAELPMSLVVTTTSTLRDGGRRKQLIQKMDQVWLMYQLLYGRRVHEARKALIEGDTLANRHLYEGAVLDTFQDLYLNESQKDDLAVALEALSAAAHRLQLLSEAKNRDFYKQFIFSKDELISNEDPRFAWSATGLPMEVN